nr:immunoglobulin heavy chain junction region [Macaca mulatta]MOX62173.1 immunoglobulin heavy chain junction region [Macaca mulatta]MOX66374.1 immunoglobulin heavy chain junction region [Macaca mulatta]MOX67378.1 immunoglobulin heavy chain junction region [Macaca mulatta]MOX67548.1 immunoglobulin heavy chain junction region [Macaca mulatta]
CANGHWGNGFDYL